MKVEGKYSNIIMYINIVLNRERSVRSSLFSNGV